jgi:hypothetical protein
MLAGERGIGMVVGISGLLLLLACHAGGWVPALAPKPQTVTARAPWAPLARLPERPVAKATAPATPRPQGRSGRS